MAVPSLKPYEHVRFEETVPGLLEVHLHSGGESLQWNGRAHDEIAEAFGDIARDPDVRVVIVTGTGDTFSGPDAQEAGMPSLSTRQWEHIRWHGERLVMNLLEIQAPVIGCLNGPALRHPEIPLLGDIVLAADDSAVQDTGHFLIGAAPGDGMHIVMPALLGPTRGRYFLITGQKLTAGEAQQLGLVNEVMPREDLLPRARALAAEIATRNPLVLRYTRLLLTHQLKAMCHDLLGYGLALQGLGVVDEGLRQEARA
ncbi:MAG: enoyl-CoA hydratase/isomerase family protein [Actinobacteria bacterium]|nr:enoyl-CoA hydratase/isomerase family protein [Actinomycetota bacterium]